MKIEYRLLETWSFGKDLKTLAMRSDVNKICDIGGGANPLLPLDFINEHGLDYTILVIGELKMRLAQRLIKHPIPWLTSYAQVLLNKRVSN